MLVVWLLVMWCTVIVVTIPGYRGYHILKNTEPLLIIKKEQAQILMHFMESRAVQPYNGPYIQAEIDLWLRVRALNHKPSYEYEDVVDLTRSSTTLRREPGTLSLAGDQTINSPP